MSVMSQFCKECKALRDMECESALFGKPPQLLALSWSRARTRMKKTTKGVTHSQFVDNTKTAADHIISLRHILDDGTREVVEYRLVSIVRHVGSNTQSGHFVSFLKTHGKGCCKFDDRKVTLQKQDIRAKNNKTVLLVYERKEPNVQQPSASKRVSGLGWLLEQTVGMKGDIPPDADTLGKLAHAIAQTNGKFQLHKAQNLVKKLWSMAQAGEPVVMEGSNGLFFGLTKNKLITQGGTYDADEGLVVSRMGTNCVRARVAQAPNHRSARRSNKRKGCRVDDRTNNKRQRRKRKGIPPVYVRWYLVKEIMESLLHTEKTSDIVKEYYMYPIAEQGYWRLKICRYDDDIEFAIKQHLKDNSANELPLLNGDGKRVMTDLSKLKAYHPFRRYIALVDSIIKRKLREYVDSDAYGHVSNIVGVTSLPPFCQKQCWHTDFQITSELATHITTNDMLVPLNGILAVDACRIHFKKGSHNAVLQHALKKNGHFHSRGSDGFARAEPSLLKAVEEQCEEITVKLDKGDIVLFSSLLVHCGSYYWSRNVRVYFEMDLKRCKRPGNSLFLFVPHTETVGY